MMRRATTFEQLESTLGIIDESASSVLHWPATGTKGIVRRTRLGQYVLLEVDGAYARLVKSFPTLDRARAYNFAIARG